MALYTSVDKVIDAYPMVGSHAGISSGHVLQAINYEESLINTMLSMRYTVPISPAPALLETVATDLTVLRLVQTRMKERLNEELVAALTRSWMILKSVGSGSVDLYDVDETSVLAESGRNVIFSTTKDEARIMTEGDWLEMGDCRRAPKATY